MLEQAVVQTKELFAISDDEIVTEKIIPISHAYVIYDLWREKNLPKLLNELEKESVYTIGRYGAWKYCSMQETLLDGKQLVDQLIALV